MAGLIIYNPRVPAAGPRNTPGPAVTRPMVDMRQTAQRQVTQDLTGAGVALGQVAAREQAERARVQLATDVMEAATEYEAEASAFENDYYEKHKGASARDAGMAFRAWHGENGRKYAERFKDNAEAALLFARSAKQSAAASVQRGFSYGRQQDEVYRQDTLNARKADLFSFAAGTDDAEAIRKRRETYAEEARTLLPGRDLTAHFAEVDREMTGNAIRSRLVAGDVSGAQAMLAEHRALLGTSYDEVAAQVQAEADKTEVMTRGDALIAKYGGDITGALSEIRATVTDPQQRAALEGRVKSEWSFRETMRDKADKEAKQARLDAAVQAIQGASTPQEMGKIVSKLPLSEQPQLYSYIEHLNKEFPSDPVAVVEVRDRIGRGEKFSIDGEYGATINRKDRAEMKALAGSEERKKVASLEDKIFENAWGKAGITGKAEEVRPIKAEVRLKYYHRMKEENATTYEAKDLIAFEETSQVVVENGGFLGLWNKTLTAPEAARRQDDGKRVRYAVPDDARDVIEKALKDQGIPVTDDTVEQAYVQNRGKFR